jgi:outer membrane protein OmpA-like peptidoglycan-associated protein
MRIARFVLLLVVMGLIGGCYPTPGPDKSVAGAVLGAGWGAGAGTVVGNQFGEPTKGLMIGSGFGAAAGLLEGAGLDIAEGHELEQQRELDALKVQLSANQRALIAVQNELDDRDRKLSSQTAGAQVFFDTGKASLRLGSVSRLQRLVDAIKLNPYVGLIEVHGHSDDMGDLDINRRVSEARARTVATFLAEHGVSIDQLKMFAHGAQRPLATNDTEQGRQLNRRVEIVLNK